MCIRDRLNIEAGWKYAKEHGIEEIIVHAPYIINLANTVKPETYEPVSYTHLDVYKRQLQE